MDRTERCEQLARLTDAQLDALIALAGSPKPTVTTAPVVGMVMLRVVEDARGELFNLGEALVTECQVRVDHEEGWAMLPGSRPHGALAAATLDAALAARPDLANAVDPRLASFVTEHDAQLAARQQRLAPTRVRFETQ